MREYNFVINDKIYKDILVKNSKDLIIQDGQLITDLLLSEKNSAISMGLIPFLALYCRSSKEFLGIINECNNFEKYVKDMRNGTKIFTDRYSKGEKMIYAKDYHHDEVFRNKLRFPKMGIMNIHLNLGVYFNKQGKIVFNTQLIDFYLNILENESDYLGGEKAYKIGIELGKEIAGIIKVCNSELNLDFKEGNFNNVPEYGYIDINTNKKNKIFNKSFDKETNLRLLHLLSTIGFVNNLLVPVFKEPNVWLLRILYISVHNTFLAMKKANNHFEHSQTNGIVFENLDKYTEDKNLLSTAFRNCMMHYNLVDKNNNPVILREFYSPTEPLFGLVESCFNVGFHEYFNKLYKHSQKIEEQLLACFNINRKDIRWDWI